MANVKLSQITTGTYAPATDLLVGVRSGTTDYQLGGVAAGPGTSVATDLVTFSGTDGLTLSDSGVALASVVTLTGTQTLTNKTITGQINTATSRSTTALSQTSTTTFANIVGLVQTVVPGTYKYTVNIQGSAGSAGGMQLGFLLTTTVLSAHNAGYQAYTASTVAAGNAASLTASQAVIMTDTAAVVNVDVTGTFVVGTGGTMQLQMTQAVSNGTASVVNIGSSMSFTRIA